MIMEEERTHGFAPPFEVPIHDWEDPRFALLVCLSPDDLNPRPLYIFFHR